MSQTLIFNSLDLICYLMPSFSYISDVAYFINHILYVEIWNVCENIRITKNVNWGRGKFFLRNLKSLAVALHRQTRKCFRWAFPIDKVTLQTWPIMWKISSFLNQSRKVFNSHNSLHCFCSRNHSLSDNALANTTIKLRYLKFGLQSL